VGVALVAVAAAAVTPSLASAQDESLPPLGPQALVAAVLGARPQQFSGTLEATSNLLGQAASVLSGVQSQQGGAQAIPEGTATVRIFRGTGPDLRLELLDPASERDLYVTSHSVWLWNSQGEQALHVVAGPGASDGEPERASQQFDPTLVAQQLVARASARASLTVGPNTFVAGQEAYTLRITPTQAGTTIGSIQVLVDASNDMVLGMSVTSASGQTALAWQFTQITFSPQPASVFAFTPPVGASVTTRSLEPPTSVMPMGQVVPHVPTFGTAWDRVVELNQSQLGSMLGTGVSGASLEHELHLLEQPVALANGTQGMLVETTLVNVLVLPSGNVLVGAVTPSVLEADAALVQPAG
jgi:outer membrane lipoprotein-sorting protein